LQQQELGEQLALEAANKSSPFATYLAALPCLADPHNTLSWENFPPSYLHLLQSPALVSGWVSVAYSLAWVAGQRQQVLRIPNSEYQHFITHHVMRFRWITCSIGKHHWTATGLAMG